jgi:hypothetical protein
VNAGVGPGSGPLLADDMADTSDGATPEVLRWIASVTTMAAGLGSGSEARAQLIGWAFVVLAVASLIWIGVGYLNGE